MYNLKNKKGFIIVEILCALSIFIMLIGCALVGTSSSFKLKKEYITKEKYISFLESIKNDVMYNFTYDELKELRKENKIYIHKDLMNKDFHENSNVKTLFTSDMPKEEPYIEMSIYGGDIFKVNLILNYKERKEEKKVKCEFYKGRYKR